MKILLILFMSIIHPFILKSQIKKYTIKGEVKNVSSGKVYLSAIGYQKKYYGRNSAVDSATIKNGKFEIKRFYFDSIPHAYRFFIESNFLSGTTDLVFISPKNQRVIIDSVNEYVAPIIIKSAVQNEMKFVYNEFFKNFVLEITQLNNYEDSIYQSVEDSLFKEKKLYKLKLERKRMSVKADSLFFQYSKKHPNSYVTLWKVIERFVNLGYKSEYFEIYNSLCGKLKNTYTGKLLLADFKKAKRLELGNQFPNLKLLNSLKNRVSLNIIDSGTKYTLIDFWFSNCAPCLREFDVYKKLYGAYKDLGFSIIGISTDNKKKFNSWKKIIQDKNLLWHQYLDPDGKLSTNMGISFFPTNLLVNDKGKIIARNISLEELEDFLKDKISLDNIYDKVETNEPK